MLRPGRPAGDRRFRPHALEFLREEHAHVRLGFSDRQIAEWFAEAGLDLEETPGIRAARRRRGRR